MGDSDRRLKTDSVLVGVDKKLESPAAHEMKEQPETVAKSTTDVTSATSRLEAEVQLASESSASSDAKLREAKLRERIDAAAPYWHWRPLESLAAREAALHAQSANLAKLSHFEERRPDPNLLIHQLTNTLGAILPNSHLNRQKIGEAVALYAALRSRDPIESILDRSMVAVNITTMDCLGRASTDNVRARELNLRYGLKGAQVQLDIIRLREARRGQVNQKVVVSKVNVEAGGQAIVGHVNAKRRKARKPE
jgi:hypothetical protein